MSADTFICQIQWGGLEEISAGRWHMRYAMGVLFNDGPWEKLSELQIDTVSMQRGMTMEENAEADCTEEKRIQNGRLIRRTDEMGSETNRRSGYQEDTTGNIWRMDRNRRKIEKFAVRRAGMSSLEMEVMGR